MKLRRILTLFVACVAVGAIAAAAVQRLSGGATGYQVRAVFDNSSFMIPGEQVKAAGVTIGKVGAVQLTAQNHAAVVLDITDPKFAPFHADAHCEIDLQSLLGEQYVQCDPSAPGRSSPALPAIGSGPNAGQHLLPVSDTTTPVGFDLLQDIYQLPEREGLQLIISGLGAGLSGNGKELNQALLRADPALESTNKVIAVLARQDRTLASLTDDSAKVLAPLAAQRKHIAGFLQHAGNVAAASARQAPAISQSLADFPAFLTQLRPAADRLDNLANQITPALDTLNAKAPSINASVKGLGPLLSASTPALESLGKAAARGEQAFPQARPEVAQLRTLATKLGPLGSNLDALLSSFDKAGGIEDLLRLIYYYAGATNGENSLGHYLRSLVEIGACSARSPTPVPGCGATFVKGLGATPAATRAVSPLISKIARQAVSTTEAKTGEPATDLAALTKYLEAGQ